MKDQLNFARNILDLTKLGELKWERKDEGRSIAFFVATYKEDRITFQRSINIRKRTKALNYRLASSAGVKITIYKNEEIYMDPEESKAFDLLDELARLIDPETDIPVIRVNLIDYVVGSILHAFNKPSVY